MEIKLLSVIVPVYKAEKTIKKDLQIIYQTLKSTPYEFEIIAVIDGTIDKSFSEAKKFKKNEIQVLGYKTNKGKGQAVRYGMSKAKGDVIMFIDAGNEINPQGIIMLLEHMKWYDADIIVGSKSHPASKVNYPLSRRIFSKGYYYFVKSLFGLRLRDTQTGLKAYKKPVLEKVLDKLVVKRFAFDIEILAVAHMLGYKKIYDAPVQVNMDFSKTTIAGLFTNNGIWNFVKDTLAIWYRMKILGYYNDGRKRVKVYDKELQAEVNTGDMTNKKQVIIDVVNKLFHVVGKK